MTCGGLSDGVCKRARSEVRDRVSRAGEDHDRDHIFF
jgi:hypothetical protein